MLKRHQTIVTAVASAVLALSTGLSGCAAGGGTSKDGLTEITVSYSAVSATQLPLFTALEGGYFKKHGLDVKLQNISGKNGIPAILSGKTQFAAVGGSEVLTAVTAGASLKYVASYVPTEAFMLYAQSKYATADRLRGQRVGITSQSGSIYIATLLALKKIGLTAKDVQLTPLGSDSAVNSALLAGSIAAGMSHPPSSLQFDAKGMPRVVDLAKDKVPGALAGVATTSEYAKKNPKVIQKFTDALVEGINRERSDRAFELKLIDKYLKPSTAEQAEATYEYYAKEVLPDSPVPTIEQFKTIVDVLGSESPQLKKVDLNDVIDPTFVEKSMKNVGP